MFITEKWTEEAGDRKPGEKPGEKPAEKKPAPGDKVEKKTG